MGDKTGISWTDATWNPVRGCSRVSEGCRHCYAEAMAGRIVRMGATSKYERLVKLVDGEPRWTGEVELDAKTLAEPLRWKRPRRIFVNSMSDLFHEKLTNEQIAAVFGVMAACPQHTFQVLTKRAARMREWFAWGGFLTLDNLWWFAKESLAGDTAASPTSPNVSRGTTWPLPNVWLGVSVENQEAANERIPELLRTPAAVRFLSCEPLLGRVDLLPWLDPGGACCGSFESCADGGTERCPSSAPWRHSDHDGLDPVIDWVIAGCESGSGARPCEVDWLRSLRDQCEEAGAPFFLKQAAASTTTVDIEHDTVTIRRSIAEGDGSKRKAGGIIELPYLDGAQHAAFPEVG